MDPEIGIAGLQYLDAQAEPTLSGEIRGRQRRTGPENLTWHALLHSSSCLGIATLIALQSIWSCKGEAELEVLEGGDHYYIKRPLSHPWSLTPTTGIFRIPGAGRGGRPQSQRINRPNSN